MDNFGIVVIGRNEGARLRRCLESLAGYAPVTVYVDSCSTDGSADAARAAGFDVVELDPAVHCTAGRARNAGVERLLRRFPRIEFVQFIDGDCTLAPGWIDVSLRELKSRPNAALVTGRRRERFPQASPYNRLCDMEWDTPVGPVDSCGGDALVRVSALQESGWFNPGIPVGEDVELHGRMRACGRQLVRIDAEMTVHDAAILKFAQWWRRNVRAGLGIGQGALGHNQPVQPEDVAALRSVVAWGLVLPALAAGLAWPTSGASLLLLGGYGVLFLRMYRDRRRHGKPPSDARLYAAFGVPTKWAQACGVLRCLWRRARGAGGSRIIEYKSAPPAGAA